jgi:hypothetical protein
MPQGGAPKATAARTRHSRGAKRGRPAPAPASATAAAPRAKRQRGGSNRAEEQRAALERVARDGLSIRNMPDRLKADREVVLAAVGHHGFALMYASAELKADRWVVLTAMG